MKIIMKIVVFFCIYMNHFICYQLNLHIFHAEQFWYDENESQKNIVVFIYAK